MELTAFPFLAHEKSDKAMDGVRLVQGVVGLLLLLVVACLSTAATAAAEGAQFVRRPVPNTKEARFAEPRANASASTAPAQRTAQHPRTGSL